MAGTWPIRSIFMHLRISRTSGTREPAHLQEGSLSLSQNGVHVRPMATGRWTSLRYSDGLNSWTSTESHGPIGRFLTKPKLARRCSPAQLEAVGGMLRSSLPLAPLCAPLFGTKALAIPPRRRQKCQAIVQVTRRTAVLPCVALAQTGGATGRMNIGLVAGRSACLALTQMTPRSTKRLGVANSWRPHRQQRRYRPRQSLPQCRPQL